MKINRREDVKEVKKFVVYFVPIESFVRYNGTFVLVLVDLLVLFI